MPSKSIRWAFNISKWNPSHCDMLLATSYVQTEEKARLGRFVFKKDFKSSLVGRLMMRKFVSNLSNKPYNSIQFLRDEKGKPYLADSDNYPQLNFNVSHQGDYVVLAGESSDNKLGIDVMKLEYTGGKSLSEFFRLMTRHFSSTEWRTIRDAGNERAQIAMFCRHWCLKESYVKAIGVGITVNLQDISFKINTKLLSKCHVVKDTELFIKGDKLSNWTFQEMLLDDEHCTAVAINSGDVEDCVFRELTFTELVADAIPLLEKDDVYCNNFFKKLDKK
ncbi:L-aminoadipate-semialdehyde dehydrogenase-phosphopantetheinyl transferase [Aethina tumida]|uniref:L-aminoadipate-semialdehyde dehydrogenase-phosphopantetheinyl transferase n=1 Tax=Aethina tumida TaxID=116153 RepID=UPI00096B43F2|nr:L-aminoadipate-semialdehyde dehydrogenase-phosphopantetheinyl transferase [Aethina tumida]